MDRPYSAFVDWLSKFQAVSVPIQALWLVAGTATLVGVAWCLQRIVSETVGALARRRGNALGEPLYAIYRDETGRLMLYAFGTLRALEAEDLPRHGLTLPPTTTP